jgi:phage gp36-like protein
MAYATRQDMEARYPVRELIERSNLDDSGADEINDRVLDRALDDASAEMDDYFDPAALPIDLSALAASSRDRLITLCCRIARKNLYFDAPATSEGKPQWQREYEEAIESLRRHQRNEADLIRYAAPAVAAAPAMIVKTRGNDRVFSRKRLGDM